MKRGREKDSRGDSRGDSRVKVPFGEIRASVRSVLRSSLGRGSLVWVYKRGK